MAGLDSRLLEALEASTCFGIAHDEDVPECKMCDVKAQCKKKSEGASIPTPTVKVEKPTTKVEEAPKKESKKKESVPASKKPASPSKPKATAPKKDEAPKASTPSGNIPLFKEMSLSDLKDLAAEKEVEWKEYGNDSITRMRLIMALKKVY